MAGKEIRNWELRDSWLVGERLMAMPRHLWTPPHDPASLGVHICDNAKHPKSTRGSQPLGLGDEGINSLTRGTLLKRIDRLDGRKGKLPHEISILVDQESVFFVCVCVFFHFCFFYSLNEGSIYHTYHLHSIVTPDTYPSAREKVKT